MVLIAYPKDEGKPKSKHDREVWDALKSLDERIARFETGAAYEGNDSIIVLRSMVLKYQMKLSQCLEEKKSHSSIAVLMCEFLEAASKELSRED